MKKLIIVVSGRKQSGKNTIANLLASYFINGKLNMNKLPLINGELHVDDKGLIRNVVGTPIDLETGIGEESVIEKYGVRMLSFAAPLKQFAMDVFGLTHQQCYGSDVDKNTFTSIKWDGLPLYVRWKYRKSFFSLRSGFMTAREVLQIFGTEVIRSIHPAAWVEAAYRRAISCNEELVFITDGRFPNELDCPGDPGVDVHVKVLRLDRKVTVDKHTSETALDAGCDYLFDVKVPHGLDREETFLFVLPHFENWLSEACLD